MANYHCIIDFETMGVDTQKSAILDCSYLMFDWDRFVEAPYTFQELVNLADRAKLDVAQQVKELGYTIDPGTVKFWGEQEPRVREKIKPSTADIKPEQFLSDLLTLVESRNIKCWWSRSNSFDPPILWRLAKDHGMYDTIHGKLPHWKVRDTRTFIDAKTNFELKSNGFCPVQDSVEWARVFEQHNSIHDIAADVLRLQTLSRIEKDLSISEIG